MIVKQNIECQRADWKQHKGLCRREQAFIAEIQEAQPPTEDLRRLGMSVYEYERLTYKWSEV